MLLITGATGNVGSEVVAHLARLGVPMRALVRDADTDALPAEAEPATGDLNRPETLRSALSGVTGVFLLPGYADMPGLVRGVAEAGATRIVQLSGGSAGSGDRSNAVTRYMADSEAAVRDSGVDWTILRPTAFMANALRWLPQLKDGDLVRIPFAHVRTATVDPFDVAAVAVAALTVDGHEGHIYYPTGPESLLPEQQVQILAETLGRELRFQAQPDDEARQEMLRTTPQEYVDAFFDFYVAGSLDESEVKPTVRDVTGRSPRTFGEWATAHAEAFA